MTTMLKDFHKCFHYSKWAHVLVLFIIHYDNFTKLYFLYNNCCKFAENIIKIIVANLAP